MNKSESIINLIAATLKVTEAVKGIDKTMIIGEGKNSYKGVPDQDVKKAIGEAMRVNGLAIFCTGIEETSQLSEWDEVSQYGTKRKQSVFTRVQTTYLLTHISGEFIEIKGAGHGVDSQDKGIGKATTYALKYCLLYTFLVPTGKIDDSDKEHSDSMQNPQATKQQPKQASETPPPTKVQETKEIIAAIEFVNNCITPDELKNLWLSYPEIQTNKAFKAAVTNKKAQLTTPKK